MPQAFIDLHSHIAWDVDDGIKTKEDAIKALEQAIEDGIMGICSTPHVICGKTDTNAFQNILLRQQELMEIAKKMGVYIYSGAEMFMNIDFLDSLDNGIFQTLNESRYMLVEFDLSRDIHYISYIDEYLNELFCRGFIPIIAHVERFFPTGLDLEMVENWLDMGCLLQTNRTSLMGFQGKVIQRNAHHLVKNKMIHLVASDTHRTVGNRIEKLSDAYQVVIKLTDTEYADQLFLRNPLIILDDEVL
ncbi:tyrosine-protein phosphatase [Faecalitalea cylindroides]|uniref:tyrosine-protein phosphatase n=1 Tax=Faecalitalea cylindroides TaxID=39483 RepID=UPI00232AD3F0|nr:CpsB/CapC family capsule biosynthesis tyrosine phosphatase [Faecalitalea cylindroides]MDB7951530.1 capsular biosynthesis protein [Faecalitalea cylindroides]MDB7958375.1 capsular biosynthesis protein [Faecalitalea cylindroides]MDB7961746.1 capsular biosynthesis protein [Faecalitalea cylindroides]MDB7962315.1 capsular biosynthesis protein [Faecalitalea cylindroides]MDB7964186.1 capsular biosynthesis protein [Faecalitalea cylindroides]